MAQGSHNKRVYALVWGITVAAAAVLLVHGWRIPSDAAFWNAVVAFAALGILCDTSFLRISFANLTSSVAFIPFLASVCLFPHPWPMVIAGATAVIVDSLVRRKPPVRVWFNTAQYMLAVGLGSIAYRALGGSVSLDHFSFAPIAFAGLVIVHFVVNSGSVALVVAFNSGVSIRESWSRVLGTSVLYDLFASSLAVLLVYLYTQFQLVGLAALIVPLFFIRHVYHMNLQLERVNRELLEVMVKAIEARDPYTSGHSVRVAEYAKTIARELALATRQVDQIATAALLHDVGKIYEEFAPLLRKEGRLTPEERMLMQGHPARSAELVGTVGEFRGPVQAAIRNHHENFDGSGYPDGLIGDQIPLGARIIMIADTLDAMTTDRPYRKAMSLFKALEELQRYAGRQFDPDMVRLVTKSTAIRRMLGPQLASAPSEGPAVPISPAVISSPVARLG